MSGVAIELNANQSVSVASEILLLKTAWGGNLNPGPNPDPSKQLLRQCFPTTPLNNVYNTNADPKSTTVTLPLPVTVKGII